MVTVTVLGSCGAWPSAGRACSGYLVESGTTRLVLDLGFGTLPRLLAKLPASEVSAVFVTHSHADHWVDLYGLYRARTLPEPPSRPLPVYSLPEVLDRLGGLAGSEGARRVAREVDFHPLGPDAEVEVGPFRVRTVDLPHFVPNLGFRVEVEGQRIAYTGDSGPSDRILELADKADLFICEATRQGVSRGNDARFLLAAAEAGRYAHDAGASRLLLTHFWPPDNRSLSRAEAAREFAGELWVADEGLELSLPESRGGLGPRSRSGGPTEGAARAAQPPVG